MRIPALRAEDWSQCQTILADGILSSRTCSPYQDTTDGDADDCQQIRLSYLGRRSAVSAFASFEMPRTSYTTGRSLSCGASYARVPKLSAGVTGG